MQRCLGTCCGLENWEQSMQHIVKKIQNQTMKPLHVVLFLCACMLGLSGCVAFLPSQNPPWPPTYDIQQSTLSMVRPPHTEMLQQWHQKHNCHLIHLHHRPPIALGGMMLPLELSLAWCRMTGPMPKLNGQMQSQVHNTNSSRQWCVAQYSQTINHRLHFLPSGLRGTTPQASRDDESHQPKHQRVCVPQPCQGAPMVHICARKAG